ncbi:hypothetical protein [Roseibium sp.]|uniref:hypothetical protein n=1 Tax=Roseibium sp. TaxID=1936156 RepID=UPI003D10EA7C
MSNNAFLSLSLGNPENPPANKRFKTLEISPWEFCRFKNSHGSKFRSFFPAAWTDPGRRAESGNAGPFGGVWPTSRKAGYTARSSRSGEIATKWFNIIEKRFILPDGSKRIESILRLKERRTRIGRSDILKTVGLRPSFDAACRYR